MNVARILLYLKGYRYFLNYDVFLFLKTVLILANSADPYEMTCWNRACVKNSPRSDAALYGWPEPSSTVLYLDERTAKAGETLSMHRLVGDFAARTYDKYKTSDEPARSFCHGSSNMT